MDPSALASWLAFPSEGGIVAAAFVAGSLVGSFLTVVTHRVPRGTGVVFGRSRCPGCGATIRARDNVPVLGWLLLRGRCRDCGVRIPALYPLVEAACGGLVAALAVAEMTAPAPRDPAAVVATWACRSALSLTLVAWALLATRGHAVSMRTTTLVATLAATAAMVVPTMGPMAIGCGAAGGWLAGLAASAVGAVAGSLFGSAAGRWPAAAACGVVGAALGWQGALLAAALVAGARAAGASTAACGAAAATPLAWHPLTGIWEAACRGMAGG